MPRHYGPSSRFVVALVTEHYQSKEWTRFELEAARAEGEARRESFLLPLLLSDPAAELIPAEMVLLDLRRAGLGKAVVLLAERARRHRGELSPRVLLEEAVARWRGEALLPAAELADLWWAHLGELELDVDRCEMLLLRCRSNDGALLRRAVPTVPVAIPASAAERLIASEEAPNLEFGAVGCLGVAPTGPRNTCDGSTRAFERSWFCPAPRSQREPRLVLRDRSRPRPLLAPRRPTSSGRTGRRMSRPSSPRASGIRGTRSVRGSSMPSSVSAARLTHRIS